MKTIAITIGEDVLLRIDRAAGKRAGGAANRSQFIREAVDDYLTRTESALEGAREREIFRRNKRRLHRQAVALIKEQGKS